MDENLRRFGENNIKGLILDLRGNPGGLLNSGVAVADHFLQKGQLIVSHHGRSSAGENPPLLRAQRQPRAATYPMVVLVEPLFGFGRGEIVSGALQDHDRAWILGDTTFGKGLVQTVLSDESIRPTMPPPWRSPRRISTRPAGLSIQRDYTNKSFYDYYFHKDTSNARNPHGRQDDRQRPYRLWLGRYHPR